MTVMEELKKLRELTDVLTTNGYLVDRTKEWEFVLDAVPALVHIVNTELKIKFVNKAFLENFGGQREDYLDLHCFDVMNSNFAYCDQNCISIVDPTIDEVFIDRLNGWYHRAKAPIYDDEQILLGYIVYLQDITERKIAEKALHDSEMKHRNIVESSVAGMHLYELNEDGQLIFVGANPAADKIMGIDNTKFIGKTIEEAFPRLVETEIPNAYKEIARDGVVHEWPEFCYEGDDGVSGVYEISAFQTSPNKMATMFNDVTKRKKAEAELKKLSSVVEQSQVSVVLTDLEGTIDYVNPKFSQVSGYSKEEAIGENPRILKAELQSQEFYKEMWDTLVAGKDWQGEFANKRKDGEIYWENAIITPMRDEDGDVTGYAAVKEDITERKIAEEQLRESKERFKLAIESTVDLVYERSIPKNGVTWFGDIDGILGYEPGEFIRSFDSWREHIVDKDRALFDNAVKQITPEHSQTSVEYQIKHKSGKLLTWIDRGNIVFDKDGTPIKVIGVCKDITKERKYELDAKKAIMHAERKIKNRLSKLTQGKDVYNILIIEDNKDVSDMIRTYLSGFDEFNVDVAEGGMVGLRKACKSTPDALILDINLPDIDGFKISKKLGDKFPELPIIVLSGTAPVNSDLSWFSERHVWMYLTKPTELAELKYVIKQLIEVSIIMKENKVFKEYVKLKDECY